MGSFDSALSEVWVVCHGQGQLAARFLSRFIPIERADRLFIAPEALSRYYLTPAVGGPHPPKSPVGATWMTSEDREREIEDYVGYLDLIYAEIFSRLSRSSVRLVLLGFSQGTATVVRWVARGNVDPDRVILWAGVMPPELDAAGAATLAGQSPVAVVLGTRDEFASSQLVSEQEARLNELRVEHEMLRFDGGHEIPAEVLRVVAESRAR